MEDPTTHAMTSDPKISGTPCVRQLTAVPAFVGNGTESLACEHCGHILADNVIKRSLVAIDIQCFSCAKLTRTLSWPDGESFPYKPLSLGSVGTFAISQVKLNERSIISCDAEIDRVRKLTRAKATFSLNNHPLSIDLINSWESELDILTGNEFSKMTAAARRARAGGNMRFLQCPPAWAIVQLQSIFSGETREMADENATASGLIYSTFHLIERWRHHHHFEIIANAICNEFHHTATMLTAAAYLNDHGNDIGITGTSSAIGQSPDLYVTTGPMSRLSIEVKAPKLFFWPSTSLSLADMERHLYRTLKTAKSQITGTDGGMVIIGASHPQPGLKQVFEAAINNVTKSGKVSTRIAAVGAVFQTINQNLSNGIIDVNVNADISAVQNPSFPGKNPVTQNAADFLQPQLNAFALDQLSSWRG